MKTLFFFLLLTVSIQGCKQYCYNCHTAGGTPAGHQCFHTEEELEAWLVVQQSSKPNQPTPCY